MAWSPIKRSVLVPFDPNETTTEALEAAASFVASPEHVTVLYVLPEIQSSMLFPEYREADLSEHVREVGVRIRETLTRAGYPDYQVAVRHGSPADVIVDEIGLRGFELVVMPSHGRRGVNRWLLGSVTERVVRLAGCPVLVLRTS